MAVHQEEADNQEISVSLSPLSELMSTPPLHNQSKVNEKMSLDSRNRASSESSSPLSVLSRTPEPYNRHSTYDSMAENKASSNQASSKSDGNPTSRRSSSPLSFMSRTPSPFKPPTKPDSRDTLSVASETDIIEALGVLDLTDAAHTELSFDVLYQKAALLVREGKFQEAIDFLFEIKMRPDFTLYQSLMCNMVIIQSTPLWKKDDILKVLQESWSGVQKIKSQYPAGTRLSHVEPLEGMIKQTLDIYTEKNGGMDKLAKEAEVKEKAKADPKVNGSGFHSDAKTSAITSRLKEGLGSDGRLAMAAFDDAMRVGAEAKAKAGKSWDDPSKSVLHRPVTSLAPGKDFWTDAESSRNRKYGERQAKMEEEEDDEE